MILINGVPTLVSGAGPAYSYTYDSMGRLNTMAQTGGPLYERNQTLPLTVVQSVSYGVANEILQIVGNSNAGYAGETRGYNSMFQMTSISASDQANQLVSMQYTYEGPNIGKISKQKNLIDGEEVQYQYDALGRMISAQTTGPAWGYSYSYDGFGNLLRKNVTKGSPSAGWSGGADAGNNRAGGASYDNNGNLMGTSQISAAYDVENRLISYTYNGTETYGYDPSNKRIQKALPDGSEEIHFYGAGGERMGTFRLKSYGSIVYCEVATLNIYFGGKRLARASSGSLSFVGLDRLGSEGQGSLYPWGEEKATTGQNTEKFATYYRDGTGLDYADQRYYSSIMGRFLTPDPSDAGDLTNPQSLNLYSYVVNDPVNYNDPEGLDVNIPLENGGSATSCLNHTLMPWFQSHGINIGDNFRNYGNTTGGTLALTLYFEDTRGSQSEYQALAQVFSNRYNLIKSNPTLARGLFGSIGTSIASVAENSSNVWSNGNLTSKFQSQLEKLIDTEVVGASNAIGASACNGLLQAMNVASDALSKMFDVSSITHYTVGSLSTNTYWFYNVGTTNPVNLNYWNTSTWTPSGFAFTFENYIGPKAPPKTGPGGKKGGGGRSPSPGHPALPL